MIPRIRPIRRVNAVATRTAGSVAMLGSHISRPTMRTRQTAAIAAGFGPLTRTAMLMMTAPTSHHGAEVRPPWIGLISPYVGTFFIHSVTSYRLNATHWTALLIGRRKEKWSSVGNLLPPTNKVPAATAATQTPAARARSEERRGGEEGRC